VLTRSHVYPDSITSVNAKIESTIFTAPPGTCFAGIFDAANVYGVGTSSWGSAGAFSSADRPSAHGDRRVHTKPLSAGCQPARPEKMYNSSKGMLLNARDAGPEFLRNDPRRDIREPVGEQERVLIKHPAAREDE
jgi:hypothetical protein